ncbi:MULTISPECIES: DMT family transporter [unclassified Leucobacter]|uniref:DMT family transporter n=1 Tax=unclassified Leucobacter TaxID=2621730 RepID=UPI001F5373C8|nr:MULTISPECIES: DMT family transporter [unclassified Leucobacter]
MISSLLSVGTAPFLLETAEIASEVEFSPKQLLGILAALVGAALLAFGAQYQSRGLNKVERITGESAGSGLSFRHVLSLLRRPSWVVGTVCLGLAVVFQLLSLTVAPIIVVQPIGVVGLVITSILNSRLSGVRLGKRAKTAIAMCVGGIVTYVTVAAFAAVERPIGNEKLLVILITYAVVLVLAVIAFLALRHRRIALLYIVGAGVLYGFVATLAKTIIVRFQQGDVEWLTWACAALLVLGALLGMVFVQNAYSSGPPDLVVAGLTVIDPLVAVLIGILVLGEASGANGLQILGFVTGGLIAVAGVIMLARFHPQNGANVLDEAAPGVGARAEPGTAPDRD